MPHKKKISVLKKCETIIFAYFEDVSSYFVNENLREINTWIRIQQLNEYGS
jgi:hypothetical protein